MTTEGLIVGLLVAILLQVVLCSWYLSDISNKLK